MNPANPDPVRASTPEGVRSGSREELRNRLEALVESETRQPVNADVQLLARELAGRPGVAGVVFYGSGLWENAGADTLYDFYVVVERFRDWAPGRMLALAGNLIPPNVYYFEMAAGAAKLRCKYAVIRRVQFEKAARGRSFTPHIWARFCQPCRLLEIRDESVRRALVRAIADAVVVFHERTLPLTDSISPEGFWEAGLRATYASEIRSEPATRATKLVAANREALLRRTRFALPLCRTRAWETPEGEIVTGLSTARKRWIRFWRAANRPIQKLVPLGRLIKAGFTFRGGLDYLRWKVERHSGVVVEITDFHRRHPVLSGLLMLWKVARRGGVR